MSTSFGETSTAEDVLQGRDLSACRVLVTGASAGVGLKIARVLAGHGAEVVGAARDLSKAQVAFEQAGIDTAPSGKARLVLLDLASLASVRLRDRTS